MAYATTTLNAGTGGDKLAHDTLATIDGASSPSGAVAQIVKQAFGGPGAALVVGNSQPMPIMVRHDGRTWIHLWAVAAAAGATGVETAITLTRSGAAGAETTTGASFAPTSGKRRRFTSVTFAARGHATATAQATTFSLRVNTAGAVTTSSSVWLAARVATPATAHAWDRFVVPFGDEGPEFAADGALQFGVTASAVFTTNAPTWDVLITGYEYS